MSIDPADAPITELLSRSRTGDEQAFSEVMSLLYQQLSDLARRRQSKEGRDHTLETAGLVHEVYLRLSAGLPRVTDRHHFVRLASRVMRNVLVDHARAELAAKRGGRMLVTLNSGIEPVQTAMQDVEGLHNAIEALAKRDPQKAQMIDLVYFGGFSGPEAAESMGVPVSTFYRELGFARAWLKAELDPA